MHRLLPSFLLPLLLLVSLQDIRIGLSPPPLTRAEVRGDTVWFYSVTDPYPPPPDTTGYGRALDGDGRWVRRGGVAPGPDPERFPASPADTVPVGRSLALVTLGREDPGGPGQALVSPDDGSSVRLGPVAITPDDKWRIFPHEQFHGRATREQVESRSLGSTSAWALGEDALWTGLRGSRAGEGPVFFGGLVRYDLDTGQATGIWRKELGAVTVSDLEEAFGRLWIGTLAPGEYGPFGEAGLLSYDPRSGEMEQYTAESSPLPSDLVWSVEVAGGRVWAATSKGVAALTPDGEDWTVARFRPDLVGDSLVFDLVETPLDSARQRRFELMEMLGIERRAAFQETARTLPRERFLPGADGRYQSPVETLAHPAFVPYLLERLGAGRGSTTASRALKRMADTVPDEAIARELEKAEPGRAGRMAQDLARAGVPAGYAWVRTHLDPSRTDSATVEAAIAAAARLKDSASVPALLGIVEQGRGRAITAIEALVTIGPPKGWEGWTTVWAWLRHHPTRRRAFLEHSRAHEAWDVWDDPAFRHVLCEAAHAGILAPAERTRHVSAEVLTLLKDPAGIEKLVEEFMSRHREYSRSQSTLEYATGVQSPVSERTRDEAAMARARDFWRTWLREEAGDAYASCRTR